MVYWELLSLQNIAFPATYLRDFADSSAATAMSADVGRCRRSCGQRATANHHARAQVDHGDQEEPALPGTKVCHVADQLVGGNGAREVAAHQIRAGLGRI